MKYPVTYRTLEDVLYVLEYWKEQYPEAEWLDEVVYDMEHLTSPKPEFGKWIREDGVRCSRCNTKLQTKAQPTFCPWCGSIMKGGNDGSD